MSPPVARRVLESEDPELQTAQLRILATSDLHMNVLGYDYYSDQPNNSIGLANLAAAIETARTENAGGLTLLLDNGDSLQGTPLGEIAAANSDDPHVLIRAFNHLGYDAIGLGNHDFNFGLDVLEHILAQAPFPVICSNLEKLSGPNPWADSIILDRHISIAGEELPIRIGVFSVLPPQTFDWDAHLLRGRVHVQDMVPIALDIASSLRKEHCDLVIALAHTGLKDTEFLPHQENAVLPLIQLEEIDALIAGHTHVLFPTNDPSDLPNVEAETGHIHGKPVVLPGFAGNHLGLIDLKLSLTKERKWRINSTSAGLRRTADASASPVTRAIEDLAADAHEATRREMSKPVGTTAQSLHSFFALFGPDRGLALVASAQAAALRGLLAGRAEANLPLLSATAPLKSGGRSGPTHYTNIPAGPLFQRHVADLHIYPNTLAATEVTGAELRDWLEMSAGLFRQAVPGTRDHRLIEPNVPGHNFDVIFGIRYQIDVTAAPRFDQQGNCINPECRRIQNLTYHGTPVTDDQCFVVAYNSYRANGGGRFPMVETARSIPLPQLGIKEILRDYLTGKLPFDPISEEPFPWSFRAAQDISVRVPTSPESRDYLSELAILGAEDMGMAADGFLSLRMFL